MNPDKLLLDPDSDAAQPESFACMPEETSVSRKRKATPEIREVIVEKSTFDGFLNTTLDSQLKSADIKEVFICGLVTSACVQATAHGAFARGYRTVLLEDCTGD